MVNPHKWLFTPVDCSVLLLRNPDALRAAFALVPEYLRTTEQGVVNLMDYGPQLGRRFRALKLWFVIRAFGTVCFRAVTGEGAADDRLNDAILAAVNAEGSTFLSATKLHGRTVLRLTIGNIRTTRAHVAQAWDVLRAGRRAAGDAR